MKGQIKFGETIAILFIFFILLSLGLVFYARFAGVAAVQEQIAAQELKTVEVSQAISFLSELACSENGVIEDGCFDMQKAIALAYFGNDSSIDSDIFAHYRSIFSNSKIELDMVYPPGFSLVLYDNPSEDFTSASASFFPIALKNATNGKYALGVLAVKIYT